MLPAEAQLSGKSQVLILCGFLSVLTNKDSYVIQVTFLYIYFILQQTEMNFWYQTIFLKYI